MEEERTPSSMPRAFQRGEHYVGFACDLRVMIYASDVSIRDSKQGVLTLLQSVDSG